MIRLAVAQGTQEEPEIQNNTCPAGRELDPECGVTPVGEGCLQHSSLITEPISEGHHYVEGGQKENKMEEKVAVGNAMGLVVDDFLTAFALVNDKLLLIFCFWAAKATGGFLELIAVNFYHPERSKDLSQV